MRTDAGKEFTSSVCQDFWERNGVKHYIAPPPIKAAIVERFNRTLGEKIEKYMAANRTRSFVDRIEQFLNAYNNAIHSSHGLKPVEVNAENAHIVYDKLYKGTGRYHDASSRNGLKDGVKVNDFVRLSRAKKLFEKGRKANYTREIFKITEKDNDGMYHLRDLENEPIKGRVYAGELHKVSNLPEYFDVEILKRKGNKILVH